MFGIETKLLSFNQCQRKLLWIQEPEAAFQNRRKKVALRCQLKQAADVKVHWKLCAGVHKITCLTASIQHSRTAYFSLWI